MANSALSPPCVVVQPHHAEHAAGFLLDGDERHRVFRIVVHELVDQLGLHFAHRREETQPQISRVTSRENPDKARHLRRLQRAQADALSIEQ